MTVTATRASVTSVLLIDDDPADNFLHRRVIDQAGAADHVEVCTDGRSALEFLTTAVDGSFPAPDLVFLDINMPRMNGWEFLEAYSNLPEAQRAKIVIVMLTTSDNPGDIARAEGLEAVAGYRVKPLTPEMLLEIMAEFFPATS